MELWILSLVLCLWGVSAQEEYLPDIDPEFRCLPSRLYGEWLFCSAYHALGEICKKVPESTGCARFPDPVLTWRCRNEPYVRRECGFDPLAIEREL